MVGSKDIAVCGIGVVSALGVGVKANIDKMRAMESGISPRPQLLATNCHVPIGELPKTNEELKKLLGITTRRPVSRTALLGMLAAKEAMDDAGLKGSGRVGLVSATSVGGMDLTEHFYRDFLRENDSVSNLSMVRMHDCAASTRAIAEHCHIMGYCATVSTACSSAANAIITGVRLLRHGVVDSVVVGGTDALSAFTLGGFKSLQILDDKPCRPFDTTRSGLNLGEGAGYLVLQRAEEAKQVYCYISGQANSNDAHHQTASSATGDGAYLSMHGALAMAGVNPEEVDYINAHGTGTPNNDLSETAAIKRLFADKVPLFSSTKGFTGHTLAAAGGIEAVFSVLSVKHGYIYPSLNFQNIDPEIGLTPCIEFCQLPRVRHVLSNSFGFGGNCSSVLFSAESSKKPDAESLTSRSCSVCYIDSIVCDDQINTDIKELIPDATARRRMSRVVKSAVTTAMECAGGVRGAKQVDAIITATGWGCLADSEKFLRIMIENDEQLLNPTPFIQSTFNTPGGQVALLAHNHCYNVTYVNRDHSLEDALFDAALRLADGDSGNVLIGTYDEQIPASRKILERMGAYRHAKEGEGSVFLRLSRERREGQAAAITQIAFPPLPIDAETCRQQFSTHDDSIVLYNDIADTGLYPTASARILAKAVQLIREGAAEVVVCNSYWSANQAAVIVVQCL